MLLFNLLPLCVCVLQVWAAVQPSITEPPPEFRRVWVGPAGGRALNGARPASMEEAPSTGPALCPNHKVRPGSARASQLCMHTSVRLCVGAECKYTLLTSDSDVFVVLKTSGMFCSHLHVTHFTGFQSTVDALWNYQRIGNSTVCVWILTFLIREYYIFCLSCFAFFLSRTRVVEKDMTGICVQGVKMTCNNVARETELE